MSSNVWKFLLERHRLMAYVAPHINEESGVRAPSLGFLLNRIHVPTCWLIRAAVTHVFIEALASCGCSVNQGKRGNLVLWAT